MRVEYLDQLRQLLYHNNVELFFQLIESQGYDELEVFQQIWDNYNYDGLCVFVKNYIKIKIVDDDCYNYEISFGNNYHKIITFNEAIGILLYKLKYGKRTT